MKFRNLLIVLGVAGCQSRGSGGGQPAAEAKHPAIPVTPMMMVAAEPAPSTTEVTPPWTLTASDGSGLVLATIDARAVVEGPLAYTELHLTFHNPEDREREGTFAITLPSGAAVSRFAMENDGEWQEAEVVDRAVARRAYDDFLHRKQDPALLEKAAGNQFSARVYPIPANADKHLVISFSQELVGRAYTLPLRGLPKTAQVDVSLAGTHLDGTPAAQTLRERDWLPDRDFVATASDSPAAVTAGDLVVGSLGFVGGAAATATAEPPKAVTMLVDTSGSRALGFKGYVGSVHALIDAMRAEYGDPIELQVIAFDQDSQPIFDGVAADYGDKQDQALLARGAAGASDLAQVVTTLASAKKLHRRVVVVSDAVLTAGPETPALIAAVENLPIDRVDVVLAGGIRDESLAASIVHTRLAHAGDVYDLDRGAELVAAGLGEPVLVDVAIEVAGASWVYPKTIPAARPGSALMVYARMEKPTQALEITIGGEKRTIGLGAATEPLIARAVAGAEIEELENQLTATEDKDAAKKLRDDIAKRSVASRVLSSQTSMLVLESDEDYTRYGIERTALADILVIGEHGIESTHRTTVVAAPKAEKIDKQPIEEREVQKSGLIDDPVESDDSSSSDGDMQGGWGFGVSGTGPGGGGTGWGTVGTGRYGTIGHGSGTGEGYGVGGGRGGMRGRSANVPQVRIGQPATEGGDLEKPIIRRYIKRNIAKVTYCYEKQLLAKPALEGTVATEFTISGTGVVTEATASGVDPEVSSCVAGVIKAIEFPRPRDGNPVKVHYPFVFRAEEEEVEEEPEEEEEQEVEDEDEEDRGGPPLTGKLADVMKLLGARKVDQAMKIATAWHDESPGDVLALIALGESLEAKKRPVAAARIYGSIIDLYPSRADFRRFAGERLERLGKIARPLVLDTYRRAVADRPDHATGHRLLAYALIQDGDHAGAFAAILAGVDQEYREDSFAGAKQVLAEDASMIAAVYLAHGGPKADIAAELEKRDLEVAKGPSTRFIMYWETDANDVDFHIRDARGGHAWYENRELKSGGELYADITTGYGPECFAIQGKPKAAPYKLSINYFEQGPMGYGMGLLQIVRFDGKSFDIDDRPYVIMTDHAFVDLGSYR